MNGKQVRLFLVDGSAGGLVTAEIMNWTGHVLAAPRSELAALLRREEVRRTGVYLLVGDEPDAPGGVGVYIGEGDDIATRLRQHARDSDSGGKDFWDRAIILTSKDANLTKAHARYLEARLIGVAQSSKRASVHNGTAPPLINLPEADVSDMEYYLSQAMLILPVLGISVFRSTQAVSLSPDGEVANAAENVPLTSPTFALDIPRYGIEAWAREIDGEFTVLAGSTARSSWIGTDRHPGYQSEHNRLLADGTLEATDGPTAVFTRDVVFASPSAAAAVVSGRSANGRTAWVERQMGVSFGQWQLRGVEST
jgi:hypothetical protein